MTKRRQAVLTKQTTTMVEKILKETYVNPKIELTQSDYNRLVELARMKAKKIIVEWYAVVTDNRTKTNGLE